MNTAVVKQVNYTTDQTATAVADYKAGVSVPDIAAKLGKTARSIVAKLSREGVYQKKEYATKTGEAVVTKAELVNAIAEKLGVEAVDVDSLESCTKATLKMVLASL
jgi:hypothetical protein